MPKVDPSTRTDRANTHRLHIPNTNGARAGRTTGSPAEAVPETAIRPYGDDVGEDLSTTDSDLATLMGRIEPGVWVTSGNRAFINQSEAFKAEEPYAAAALLEEALFKPKTSSDWADGQGHIKYSDADIAALKGAVLAYLKEYHPDEMKNIKAQGNTSLDGPVAKRLSESLRGKPIFDVLWRMGNIDPEGREWDQVTYRDKPTKEGLANCINSPKEGKTPKPVFVPVDETKIPDLIASSVTQGGFKTTNKKAFPDLDTAIAHERLLFGLETLNKLMPELPEKDQPRNWSKWNAGELYVQHSPEAVKAYAEALRVLISAAQPGCFVGDEFKDVGVLHPRVKSYVQGTHLYGAWLRLQQTGPDGREWSSHAFVQDPPMEAKELKPSNG